METKPLGEFNIYINDGNYGGIYPDKELFLEEGIPLISSSDFSGRTFNYEGIKFISEELHFGTLTKGHLKINDVIVVVRGSVGKVGFFKDEIGECNLNPQLAFIRTDPKELNPLYLYYLLSSKKYSELLKRFATGSVQPQLPINRLKLIPIVYPDLSTQQKIAAVLSALDAKIELNARINAELESMAKTLYDYWFVQFAYPHPSSPKWDGTSVPFGGGAEGGGGLVWNEALKREIPLGWEVDNIMRLGDLLGGGTPKTSEPSYWGGNIPFFTPKDTDDSIFVLNTMDYITEAGLESCSSRLYPKGTIFITARGTVGKINVASQDMAMNQSCYAIQAKPEINYYFLHQHSVHLVQYLKAKSNGSIFDAIVSNDIKLTPIVIPPLSLIQKFGEHTKGLYEKILVNKQESQTLTALRDWLLPMLMNGQITIHE